MPTELHRNRVEAGRWVSAKTTHSLTAAAHPAWPIQVSYPIYFLILPPLPNLPPTNPPLLSLVGPSSHPSSRAPMLLPINQMDEHIDISFHDLPTNALFWSGLLPYYLLSSPTLSQTGHSDHLRTPPRTEQGLGGCQG